MDIYEITESLEQLRKNLPIMTNELSDEQRAIFLKRCYALYETEGFTDKFFTNGMDYREYIGSPFSVVCRTAPPSDDEECWPMWLIRFDDGVEIKAYPEEIVLSEMKSVGYRDAEEFGVLDEETI